MMGLGIRFHGGSHGYDEAFSLATAHGWKLLREWVESLPATDPGEGSPLAAGPGYPTLKMLCDKGECVGTHNLCWELVMALRLHPPTVQGVKDTARKLAAKIGVGWPDEYATVTL
jgi:hypothetical protein